MLTHPMPDPVVFSLGPVDIHWYGLMYVVAFALFLILGRVRVRQPHIAAQGWKNEDLDDMLFYGMLGVIIGGRLGEVLFYRPGYFFANPVEIFKVWEGGMSYHGGFIGVVAAMALWARQRKRSLMDVLDFIAPLVPPGYAAASVPWAMRWPDIRFPLEPVPVFLEGLRHPSPLYQALIDGLIVFAILWVYASRARPKLAVGAMYTLLYGCARFITEYFRTPDWEVSVGGVMISSGQVLSLPMIALGIGLLVWAYRQPEPGLLERSRMRR
jgi:phosphatidylglycerol---prolipoprotein diacylglyceryl transferase